MRECPGYAPLKIISESGELGLYRAWRRESRECVLLKMPLSEHASGAAIRKLEHEYEVSRELGAAFVVRPLRIEHPEGGPVLVLEDDGEQRPVSDLLGAPMEAERFLEIAIGATGALAEIHRHDLIHKNLSPRHLFLNALTGGVRIDGFGIAAMLPTGSSEEPSPGILEGTLAYMSPEQTGRMNRPLDYRSDFYSLGIAFFEMLSGVLPFSANSPLGWVHCHLAQTPQALSELVPGLPEMLSRIVMKLLAKAAQDRYHSAEGLRGDLQECRQQWHRTGRIEIFPLGSRDFPERLEVSPELFGRQAEQETLRAAFERVAQSGQPECVLVSGPAGMGKSALVGELQSPIVERHGFFSGGKFDQLQRAVPYATLAQGLRDLVRQVFTQSKEELGRWRTHLQEALGLNAQLMVDLVPEVSWILGPQPAVVPLPLAQTRSRFQLVLRNFLRTFASAEHPLVLFLDDLQWSDSASLESLEQLLTDAETGHLLVVGAYREHELAAAHPLRDAVKRLRCARIPITEIVLGPLALSALRAFTAQSLHCPEAQVEALARLIEAKTGGTPFYVIQFLRTLEEEGLIVFEPPAWRWDLAEIRAQHLTDNMVEFMGEKLARLPAASRALMHLAACLGDEGPLSTLAWMAAQSEEGVLGDLRQAFQQGLILGRGAGYLFLHDQVRESAYALEGVQSRQKTHLKIGRLLLAKTAITELRAHIFEIVYQLNHGAPLIDARAEKLELAGLNLVAGQKARETCAYTDAIHYLEAGIALLDEGAWEDRLELAYRLCFERAQCDYLSSHFEEALHQFEALRRHTPSASARAEIVRAQIEAQIMRWQLGQAVACGIEGLRSIGMEIPPQPDSAQIQAEYELVWQELGSRSIAQLADLPPMGDPRMEATMLMLAAFQPANFFTNRTLYLFCCCRMVNLSIREGHCPDSVIAYAALGVALGPTFGQYREGFEFGELASRLLERLGLLGHQAEVHFLIGGLINPWRRPIASCIERLEQGFKVAGEIGDLIFGCYCATQIVWQKLLSGEPLEKLSLESERMLDYTRRARSEASVQVLVGLQRFIETMRGLTTNFATFGDAHFDEPAYDALMDGYESAVVPCGYYILKLQARFLAGKFGEALEASARARPLLWSVLGMVAESQHCLYEALSLAAQWREPAPATPPRELLENLGAHAARLGVWAENCPDSFFHGHALVCAEMARIQGENPQAARLFEQAIHSARTHGFVQDEALAFELASRFYQELGFEVSARAYLRKARDGYVRWGVEGKVRQLEAAHPWLVEARAWQADAIAAPQDQLDLMTVIKASQAISREIVLEQLLETLLQSVLENAGAQRVSLLLLDEGEPKLAATHDGQAMGPLYPSTPASEAVPQSIINYVLWTREKVLLDDAAAETLFAHDPYLEREKPRSVLCLPILQQSALVGLLYLENKLVPGAFTPDRLAVLELLASQAAISLQNAQFYAELQQENQVRKRAEEEVRTLNADLEARVEERTAQLRQSLEKEELLRKEVHHRIKNNLQVISSLLFLQSLASPDPGTQEVLRESQARTRSIALIHEKLYQSSDMRAIDFGLYIRQLAAALMESYKAKPGAIELRIHAEGVFLEADTAVPCGLIINELISNALKYAFPENSGGLIEIHFEPPRDGFFHLCVHDSGCGLPPGFDPQTAASLGVRLVRDLTLQLGGSVEFRTQNGTRVDIAFPQ